MIMVARSARDGAGTWGRSGPTPANPTDGPLDEDEDDDEAVADGGVAAEEAAGGDCRLELDEVALLLPRSRSTGAGRPGRLGRAGGVAI